MLAPRFVENNELYDVYVDLVKAFELNAWSLRLASADSAFEHHEPLCVSNLWHANESLGMAQR